MKCFIMIFSRNGYFKIKLTQFIVILTTMASFFRKHLFSIQRFATKFTLTTSPETSSLIIRTMTKDDGILLVSSRNSLASTSFEIVVDNSVHKSCLQCYVHICIYLYFIGSIECKLNLQQLRYQVARCFARKKYYITTTYLIPTDLQPNKTNNSDL